jgi:hypothetical protein
MLILILLSLVFYPEVVKRTTEFEQTSFVKNRTEVQHRL